jgi:uncharacterized glyoxalase superfamily protein PhnB
MQVSGPWDAMMGVNADSVGVSWALNTVGLE